MRNSVITVVTVDTKEKDMRGFDRSGPAAPGISRRALMGLGAASFITLGLAACAPGSSRPAASASGGAVSTTLPKGALTLHMMANTEAAPAITKLGNAFTKQHPNIKIEVTSEADTVYATNLARILTRSTPPDLLYNPTVSQHAKDGLLASLDPYFDAYGWSSWSRSAVDIDRIKPDGERGTGSLYAVGIGENVTGVFYNKKLAKQLGLTLPPKTFAEFDAACRKAQQKGILALSVGAKDAGTPFLLQEVQNAYGNSQEISDWIYLKPGASFDQPGMLKAATKLQEWKNNGIISKDALAVAYTDMMADFQAGKALFVATGDWECRSLTTAMGDNVGFFLMPTDKPGAKQWVTSFPTNYSIPSGSKNKDVTAYFLNWVHTDKTARQLIVDVIGCSPGGPTDLPAPHSDVPLIQQTQAAYQKVLRSGSVVDFIAAVGQGFTLTTFNPLMQALMLESKTPQQFIDATQAAYESQLAIK